MVLNPCSRHKLEGKAYSYLREEEECLSCFREKLDILWRLQEEKAEKKSKKGK